MGGIVGFLQNAPIELQPRHFAIDESVGAAGRGLAVFGTNAPSHHAPRHLDPSSFRSRIQRTGVAQRRRGRNRAGFRERAARPGSLIVESVGRLSNDNAGLRVIRLLGSSADLRCYGNRTLNFDLPESNFAVGKGLKPGRRVRDDP
jgi:hypothetical protein